MDIVLLSGRSRTAEPDPSRDQAATLARDLAAAGHRIRWICPVQRSGGPAVQLPTDSAFLPVLSRVPGFRAVAETLHDVPTDRLLSQQIRARLPDVVHVLAYGGASAANAVWIADRLGAPAVVDVRAEAVLCHRGTLIDERDEHCREWRDPERCRTCCLTPFEGGLTPAQARRSRWTRPLGAWSSFPLAAHFGNRLEALLAGLLPAAAVLVEDQAQYDLLVEAGVPARPLRIAPRPHTADGVLEIYAAVAGRRDRAAGSAL